jgi:Tfp pilus assembly protein PilW
VSRKRRGTSLIELVIAMFISLLILGATYELFVNQHRLAERPRASMAVQEGMAQAVRWLQKDLSETNLQTIRTYTSTSDGGPGLSMESPRHMESPDRLEMGTLGIVKWQKFVYYTLIPRADGYGTGRLVRREGDIAANVASPPAGDPQHRIPVASSNPPSTASCAASRERTLAQNVMLAYGKAPTLTLGPQGGFYVYWPDFSSGASPKEQLFTDTLRGEPVLVQLYFKDHSPTTGRETVLTYRMSITPRN